METFDERFASMVNRRHFTVFGSPTDEFNQVVGPIRRDLSQAFWLIRVLGLKFKKIQSLFQD